MTDAPAWTVVGDLQAIAPAWVAALGELEEIARSRTADAGSYKYTYAELGDVLSHSRPVLAKHDLVAFQVPQVVDGEVSIETTVMHSSGAYLVFAPFNLPAGNTAQSTGSAATYARRYSVTSILGLATDDNDGATAGTRTPKPVTLSVENVDRFLTAAHDATLSADEIGQVVSDATGGRTQDPAAVYVSEVPALREALARHTHATAGVSDSSGDTGEQYSPVSPGPGEVEVAPPVAEASPDQPLPLEDEES